MQEKVAMMKSALVATGTAVAMGLGWKGALLLSWVAVMALDYLSGTLAACREGQWSSAVARQGLWHKGGMILVVTASAISDVVMVMVAEYVPMGIRWPGIVLPLVLVWYIVTELGSILENAVKMGAKVPGWLIRILKASAQLADNAGETVVPETE